MEIKDKNKAIAQGKTDLEMNIHKNPIIRWAFMISGFILIGIGILGMFLPLLPTTIFLILAAWCFAKSSERFHYWVHHNRWFGKYLRDYRSGNGMPLRSKILSITMLWAGILISGVLLTDNLYIRILLAAVAIGVTWHLVAIKTAGKND
jgi:uncharacterized protein